MSKERFLNFIAYVALLGFALTLAWAFYDDAKFRRYVVEHGCEQLPIDAEEAKRVHGLTRWRCRDGQVIEHVFMKRSIEK